MNSGATSERVYDALKRQIVDGGYRPGERLDAAMIGEALSSSVTPVRDALHLLTGEGLVATRMSEGFHIPPVDAPGVEDLYVWNGEVSIVAVKGWPAAPQAPIAFTIADYPDQVAQLFDGIAHRSGNAEHRRTIASLNDRLRPVRMVEGIVLPGCGDEIAALAVLLDRPDRSALRVALVRYHRRRRQHAAELVRALYRPR